ncbi:hypothetical protein [Alicyclobacillus sendaiensis]|uniref:hypothetical protein n=1 Tax=Alicyclobacillus sendaiensis TaxID=192387 RepID=UPI0026F42DC7|nr:hypothetical protein [Alicyclobacillus sendaiensis]
MEEQILFDDYGIEVLRKDRLLYLRYDAGEIVPNIIEIPITVDEFRKAVKSPQDAYEVILSIHNYELRNLIDSNAQAKS